MEKQILEILEKYEDVPADFKFVKDILLILRNHYHAEEYLKKILVYRYISLSNKKRKFGGLYDSYDKAIYIDISPYDNFDISQLEKNIGILVLILHEFTHAMQYKDRGKNNFENKLLAISNYTSMETKYSDLHDYIPIERLANIQATTWCINILSKDPLKYQYEIFKKKKLLYHYILGGYEVNDNTLSSSLETILKEINQYDNNKSLIDYGKQLSFSERLLYGLPISMDEYNNIVDIYNKQCEKVKNKTKLK